LLLLLILGTGYPFSKTNIYNFQNYLNQINQQNDSITKIFSH
jgi:hypothetical protein